MDERQPPPANRHFIRYEGGQIGIDGDRQAAVAWYCRHLQMQVVFDNPAEGQTLLRFRQRHAIPLVSTDGGERLSIWPVGGGECSREPNVRLTFTSANIPRAREALVAEGVRVGPVGTGPGGLETFDFWDLEGTRLTAIAVPPQVLAAHRGRFTGYGPPRIGVRRLADAIPWYQRVVGAALLKEHPATGAALLTLGDFLPIWLEELPASQFTGRQIAYARPYLLTLDIEAARAFCAAEGLAPSLIYGLPGSLRLFHFFDPDGNAIGVWTYPGAPAKIEE